MSEQALDDLQAIVDRLGPDVWLELNEVSFPRYFGIALGVGQVSSVARDIVSAFAERNRLALIIEDDGRIIRLGRAYHKKDADA